MRPRLDLHPHGHEWRLERGLGHLVDSRRGDVPVTILRGEHIKPIRNHPQRRLLRVVVHERPTSTGAGSCQRQYQRQRQRQCQRQCQRSPVGNVERFLYGVPASASVSVSAPASALVSASVSAKLQVGSLHGRG